MNNGRPRLSEATETTEPHNRINNQRRFDAVFGDEGWKRDSPGEKTELIESDQQKESRDLWKGVIVWLYVSSFNVQLLHLYV